MTNLCIIRVARGAAASTTWAALVLLDKVGIGIGKQGQGRRVIPHVIYVSGTSHFAPDFVLYISPGFVK
jgi:RNase P/RNase MRP subunit POP5